MNDLFVILLLQLDDLLKLLQVVLPHFFFICELLQVLLLLLKFGHFVTNLLDLGLILSLQVEHFLLYLQKKLVKLIITRSKNLNLQKSVI